MDVVLYTHREETINCLEATKMTKKKIETAINEARIWGECFLGNVCFDTVKDYKKVNNYLSKNNIEDVSLYHCDDGWFMIYMN